MRIVPTAVLALVLAPAITASAGKGAVLPVKGLEKARWGMSRAQVRAAFPSAKKKISDGGGAVTYVIASLSVEGVPAYVELHFDKRGLSSVFGSSWNATDWEQLRVALDGRLAVKPVGPASYPVWTDSTTDVSLASVTGCHPPSLLTLWMGPAR